MTFRAFIAAALAAAVLLRAAPATRAADAPRVFKIQVVDEATGRGVPLVELTTTNQVRYYTDSHGFVAFAEPGLMNQRVFFGVKSHGYTYPKDGFGSVGTVLETKEGGSAIVRIKRVNIAERLYRITGTGIYRDSVLVGEQTPLREPLLNGQVTGQDSVLAAVYQGKLYWFWGDTNRPSYPLGHFGTAGATSELPDQGGLDPGVGVDLTYFVGKDGFSRPMCPMKTTGGANLVWIDGVMTVPDDAGQERLVAGFSRRKSLTEAVEQGLMVYNDQKQIFEKTADFDLKNRWQRLQGHPVTCKDAAGDWRLFPMPWPVTRTKPTLAAVGNPASYEAFTCLEPGSRYDRAAPKLQRGADGKLVWGWKAGTDPIQQKEEKDLVAAGKLTDAETRFGLHDVESGKPVTLHSGSFCWNAYRKKWILIGVQAGGTSYLGEVWFAEADDPTGPWRWARKIVTHEQYTFYNPVQHPFFDQDGGRLIYFEGTYANTFSGNPNPTPHYDYNQIMYRLDLSDPRLRAPLAPAK